MVSPGPPGLTFLYVATVQFFVASVCAKHQSRLIWTDQEGKLGAYSKRKTKLQKTRPEQG
jgi:hypothetical protein